MIRFIGNKKINGHAIRVISHQSSVVFKHQIDDVTVNTKTFGHYEHGKTIVSVPDESDMLTYLLYTLFGVSFEPVFEPLSDS